MTSPSETSDTMDQLTTNQTSLKQIAQPPTQTSSENETRHNTSPQPVASTNPKGNQQQLRRSMSLNVRKWINKSADLKVKTVTSDAFPFLRQTSSGRIVKRTQLASLNANEFVVDRPARAKSTSPKQTNITKYLNKTNDKLEDNSSVRRNSTGSLTAPNKDVDVPIFISDGTILTVKSERTNGSDDADKNRIDVRNSLLHVKLDHDYGEKKPAFSELKEMQTEDNVRIKREIDADGDEVVDEMSPRDVKAENESLIKKEELVRNRKKARLSSEVRTLIDESIKATKTLSFPTSRLRKPRSKLRNKQRRTECEMLLDMLTENPGPDNLIRVKRSKEVVFNSHALKNIPKAAKVQKLPSPKAKEEAGGVAAEETPAKARDKKPATPLVAQKKNKAIKMKLKLEKKKKVNSPNDAKNVESPGSAKSYKSIVLQDLKEKVKAKMEKTEKKSPEVKCGELISYYKTLSQRRLPGRPRIHHNPQLPKPAKVSRHGRILGRPRKSSESIKDVHSLNETIFPVNQAGCFVKLPYVSLSPTPALGKHYLFQAKVRIDKDNVLADKACDVEFKDCCRQRSSQRQAESSYKYKDIAVKFHKGFAQIILLFSLVNPKSGLNPQVLKELKGAFMATAKDNNCKLVLLNGVGNIFCSGIDLTYIMKENKEQRQKAIEDTVTAMRDFLQTLITYPKPIVVAVNGLARGLGVSLLLLCDVIYASDKAVFEMPYAQLGHVPEGCASLTLPRSLSISMANDLLFTGRRLTAAEAHQCGLVSQVFWPNDLLEQVLPRVQKMATQNGMVTTKALLRQKMKCELESTLENECQLLMNQWCHPECQKSMKEFLEQPFP